MDQKQKREKRAEVHAELMEFESFAGMERVAQVKEGVVFRDVETGQLAVVGATMKKMESFDLKEEVREFEVSLEKARVAAEKKAEKEKEKAEKEAKEEKAEEKVVEEK